SRGAVPDALCCGGAVVGDGNRPLPMARPQRRSLMLFAVLLPLAGANCMDDGASDSSGIPSGPGAGGDAGAGAGTDAGTQSDGAAIHGDAGDAAGGSQCAPACSGAAPVCDRGVCKTCTST